MQTQVLTAAASAATTITSSSSSAKSFWLKKEYEECNVTAVNCTSPSTNGIFKKQQWTLASSTLQSHPSSLEFQAAEDGINDATNAGVWDDVYCKLKDKVSIQERSLSSRSSSGFESASPRSSTGSNTSISNSCNTNITNNAATSNCGNSQLLLRYFERPKMQEEFSIETSSIDSTKYMKSSRAPKRFETKCYFYHKLLPVWYSESIVLKIGSTKRKHTESVEYQPKLLPYRWTETMTTTTPNTPQLIPNFTATLNIPMLDSYKYLDLQPQQLIAEQLLYNTEKNISFMEI